MLSRSKLSDHVLGRYPIGRVVMCCLILFTLASLTASCRFFAPSEVSEPVMAPTMASIETTPTPSLIGSIPTEPTATPLARPTTISGHETVILWHSLSPDSPEGQALAQSLERFELTYPQINVLDRYRGTDTELAAQLYEAVDNSNMPDVIITSSGTMALLAKSQALISLENYMALETDVESDFEHALSSLGACYGCNEGIYSIPYMIDSVGLWYNPSLLETLDIQNIPTTWEEFADVCQYASGSLGTPAVLLIPDGRVALALVLSSGEKLTEAPPFFELGDATSDVLSTIQDLAWSSSILLETGMESAHDLFLEGDLLFCLAGTDFLSPEEIAESQLKVAPLPQFDTLEATYLVYGWHIGISADPSESRGSSWTLVNFLTSTQEAAQVAQISGHPPLSRLALSLLDTNTEQAQLTGSKANVFYDGENIGESIVGIDGIEAILSDVLVNITNGFYVPDEALKLAHSSILRLLAYYGITS